MGFHAFVSVMSGVQTTLDLLSIVDFLWIVPTSMGQFLRFGMLTSPLDTCPNVRARMELSILAWTICPMLLDHPLLAFRTTERRGLPGSSKAMAL